MPLISEPTLLCDRCGKKINRGTTVKVVQVATFLDVNFAVDAFHQNNKVGWPVFKEQEPTTKYYHYSSCYVESEK